MTHPKVAQQPACADRLTLSRERIQALIDRADARPEGDEWENGYALGFAEALDYLLNADHVTPMLVQTLGIDQ